MARIPRALFLIVLLLLMACRFTPAHREAVVRFAVSTILDIVSTPDTPGAAQVATHTVRTLPLCAYRTAKARPPAAPAAKAPVVRNEEPEPISIPVRNIEIATAALRPAADCPDILVRTVRFDSTRRRVEAARRQLAAIERHIARCPNEARAAVVLEELREAHVFVPAAEERACSLAPGDAPEAVEVPVLDMRVRVTHTVGG